MTFDTDKNNNVLDNITTYAISIHFTLQQAPPNPKIVKINSNSPERIKARGIDPTKSDKVSQLVLSDSQQY
jgi:hypothetical protein